MITIKAAVLLMLLLAFSSLASLPIASPSERYPIDHVIVIVMDDSTFDHYFGTFPGADGFPENFSMPVNPLDPSEGYVKPFKLPGVIKPELSSEVEAAKMAYNEGAMNGFIYAQTVRGFNGTLSMGYNDYRDVPFFWGLAKEYVLSDRWFATYMGASLRNHLFLFAAQYKGYKTIPENGYELTTILDLLQERGISWKIYIQSYDPSLNYTNKEAREALNNQLVRVPILSIPRFVHDPSLNSRIQDLKHYYADLGTRSFPNVSFIFPLSFGEEIVADLLSVLMESEYWYSSAFIIVWAEWGGWADHVPPPRGYGFRVPAIIVSPYAKRGYIDSTVYDHTSILAFIETLFDLPPLTEYDATANNLMNAFDFSQPPRPPVLPPRIYDGGTISATPPSRDRSLLLLIYSVLILISVATLFFLALSKEMRKRA